MALIDKMKAQASQLAQKAQEAGKAGQAKISDAQSKRKADAMLRDLGAAFFAQKAGRGTDDTQKEIDRLVSELTAFETENGPIGAADPADSASDAPSASTESPTAPDTPETPEGGFKL